MSNIATSHAVRGTKKHALRPLQFVFPLLIAGLCLWTLQDQLETLDLNGLLGSLSDVGPMQWMVAALATIVSFWALARYDVHVHAICRTQIDDRRATQAGATAIGLSQITGFGLFVGTYARWKLLPELSMVQAAKVTGAVSVVFLIGWSLLLGLMAFLPGGPLPFWLGPVMGVAALCLLMLSILRVPLPGRAQSLPLPSVLQNAKLFGLTTLDLVAAAAALYVLLPDTAQVSFLTFVPVFVMAFGIGLYSGSPGGIGPFELAMVTLLKDIPAQDVLSAILAFRLIYFALPGFVAILWLLRDHLRETPPVRPHRKIHVPLMNAPRAESALVRQNGGFVHNMAGSSWAIVDTGQTFAALFDPVRGCAQSAVPLLKKHARKASRLALLYKVCARTACVAREAGWAVTHIADEAILPTKSYDLNASTRRQLRRKLRQAERAGLEIRIIEPKTYEQELSAVSQVWTDAHGRERGVSMGRFDLAALADQIVVAGFEDGDLVAFASFHKNAREMCLDLVRYTDDAPAGSMHAIVHHAVGLAQKEGIPRVSLAAVPVARDPEGAGFIGKINRHIAKRAGADGLRRFKQSFGPQWHARYAAAPGRLALILALVDMARVVHWPDRIVRS
ncbi:phosphatidylglycerol lysyltransferase domain-containing protein [Primorskyibacter sp. S187A]|uniref:phosphatidylglycerol lysyltransferase domain-containing protein n=1 Tax=Primorskyibacter sp. S187A TaxID=3415130 RepID=UPI003C7B734C